MHPNQRVLLLSFINENIISLPGINFLTRSCSNFHFSFLKCNTNSAHIMDQSTSLWKAYIIQLFINFFFLIFGELQVGFHIDPKWRQNSLWLHTGKILIEKATIVFEIRFFKVMHIMIM